MTTYTLKLYTKTPGRSVEMGDGAIHFEVGDDATAIRYALSNLADAISDHGHVMLFQGERFVWEKDGNA